MDKHYLFKIVTPERVVFEDTVNQVSLPTPQGEITVLKNHASLVSTLSAGEMRIVDEKNKMSILAVAGGLVYIANNTLVVLADSAVHAEAIDVEAAEKARARAQKTMEEKVLDSEEYAEASAIFARELTKLRVARKHKKTKSQSHPESIQ